MSHYVVCWGVGFPAVPVVFLVMLIMRNNTMPQGSMSITSENFLQNFDIQNMP